MTGNDAEAQHSTAKVALPGSLSQASSQSRVPLAVAGRENASAFLKTNKQQQQNPKPVSYLKEKNVPHLLGAYSDP